MKILTKKQEKNLHEKILNSMLYVAHRAYDENCPHDGSGAIPDRRRQIDKLVEETYYYNFTLPKSNF